MRTSVSSLLVALAFAAVVRGPAAAPRTTTHPYAGLTYTEASTTTPRPIRTHVIQVDLRASGIRLTLTPPAGPRETIRQSSAAFVSEVHAQAGINGHFFLPFPSTDTSASR